MSKLKDEIWRYDVAIKRELALLQFCIGSIEALEIAVKARERLEVDNPGTAVNGTLQ